MTTQSRPQVGFAFWFVWVFICVVSRYLSLSVIVFAASIAIAFSSNVVFVVLDFFIVYGIWGIVIGAAQRFMLTQAGSSAKRWVLLSAAGWAIGGAIYGSTIGVLPSKIGGLILGTSIGLMQWIVLRKYVRQAGVWIIVNAIGGLIDQVLIGLISGLINGIISAFIIVWLLRHPIQQPEQSTSFLTSV